MKWILPFTLPHCCKHSFCCAIDATYVGAIQGQRNVKKVTLIYLCTGVSGTFIPNEEVSAIRYFDTGKMPALTVEQRTTIEKALVNLNSEVIL